LAPDETPPNPYASSTYSNTHPAWLDNAQGTLNADVKANLDDLKGFSANLDEIQGNFAEMGRGVAEPMRSSVAGAFPTGGDHGLEWEAVMNSLGVYNAFQFQTFVANLALGIKNVASAASAVANSYANTDDTSAANMAAIDFAFGDTSKVPGGFPSWALDQIPTWKEFSKDHPIPPPAEVPKDGLPPGAVTVTTSGNTTTTTVKLPGGGTMVTTEEHWGAYGSTGVTTTVVVNGQVRSKNTTYTYGGATHSEDREYTYDKDGKPTGDRVVRSGETSTHTYSDGSERTDDSTTTYQYDDEGNAIPSTSGSSVTVGSERPHQGSIPFDEDPAQRAIQELMPEPDPDTVTLAPGPLGDDPGGGQPPGTVTV